jgi:hypothetical protein
LKNNSKVRAVAESLILIIFDNKLTINLIRIGSNNFVEEK